MVRLALHEPSYFGADSLASPFGNDRHLSSRLRHLLVTIVTFLNGRVNSFEVSRSIQNLGGRFLSESFRQQTGATWHAYCSSGPRAGQTIDLNLLRTRR